MSADDIDPVTQMRATKKRRAAVGLGVLLCMIAGFVAVMLSVANDMSRPVRPLDPIHLTQTPTRYTVSVPEAGPLALWVDVAQTHETGRRSTTPVEAAEVHVQIDEQRMVCGTTDVVAFGTLNRIGRSDQWIGRLQACSLGRVVAGNLEVSAWWTPIPNDHQISVERVTLIPSLED